MKQERRFRVVWVQDKERNYGLTHTYEKAKATADQLNEVFPMVEFWVEEIYPDEPMDKARELLEVCFGKE